MTVRELIKQLLDYNLDAKVFVGDNLYNTPELSYGGGEGCTKKNCQDVGIQIVGNDNCETPKGSGIPIPKTVDEAVKTLAKIVSKEDRDYLLENGAISVHHSMGRWIRNEWGLWTDSELKDELKQKGFEHPDDMSNYIIEELIKYWNSKI